MRFRIRDLLWLMTVVATLLLGWADRIRCRESQHSLDLMHMAVGSPAGRLCLKDPATGYWSVWLIDQETCDKVRASSTP